MRTRKHFIAMAFIAIITLAIIGCKHDAPPSQPTLPNGVGIYKGEGVTDAQFAEAVQNVIAGYNDVTGDGKTGLNNVLTKIVIISHKNYTWDGHILGLKYDLVKGSITPIFEAAGSGGLPQVAW
jgi:hypothetical protein